MCLKTKVIDNTKNEEVIKTATRADASVRKTNADNGRGNAALISENIKTTNNGLNDEVTVSKKKLLGE